MPHKDFPVLLLWGTPCSCGEASPHRVSKGSPKTSLSARVSFGRILFCLPLGGKSLGGEGRLAQVSPGKEFSQHWDQHTYLRLSSPGRCVASCNPWKYTGKFLRRVIFWGPIWVFPLCGSMQCLFSENTWPQNLLLVAWCDPSRKQPTQASASEF